MENKKILIMALVVVALTSLVAAYGAGYYNCYTGFNPNDTALSGVVGAWNLITEEYVEPEKIDTELLAGAAISGMMAYLDDPYSSYLSEQEFQLTLESFEGKYEGIGIVVAYGEDEIVITGVFNGSPAEEAGIKEGDVILEVDGVPVSKESGNEFILGIRGEIGTVIELLLLDSQTQQIRSVSVTRQEITSPSVDYEIIGDIVYIEISRFTDQTDKELETVFKDIEERNLNGILLDLRGNPGGRVSTVVDVGSRFIMDDLLLFTIVYNDGSSRNYNVVEQEYTTDLPLVVLVDEFSASGSEVLSGFLQDYNRAIIIGEVTYGKGSVNNLYELTNGSGLYLTIARWYTPLGHLIEGQGITPDVETELQGEELLDWALNYILDNY